MCRITKKFEFTVQQTVTWVL